MKLGYQVDGDLRQEVERDIRSAERAVTSAMRGVKRDLVDDWRDQVRAAGLGKRLANSIRGAAYPSGTESINAAVVVYTKAPKIIEAMNTGPVIRAKNGHWLAIPLPAAGFGRFGRKMTPKTWQQRYGMPLRFVHRPGSNPLLVADDARLTVGKKKKYPGQARPKRGKRRQDGILPGATTVPVFVLVPQVRLRKRLDLERDVQGVAASLPVRIERAWDDD